MKGLNERRSDHINNYLSDQKHQYENYGGIPQKSFTYKYP